MVTIRDRDTMKQERVAIDALHGMIAQKVGLHQLFNQK
jgi:glycyl-tRNA synthetase (class II)